MRLRLIDQRLRPANLLREIGRGTTIPFAGAILATAGVLGLAMLLYWLSTRA